MKTPSFFDYGDIIGLMRTTADPGAAQNPLNFSRFSKSTVFRLHAKLSFLSQNLAERSETIALFFLLF